MKTKKSPLKLIDFAIINSNINFEANSISDNLIKDQDSYNVDIDFDILRSSSKKDFQIKMNIKINEKGQDGYKINVSGLGFFLINDITDENVIASLINYSALNICIANIRSFIVNVTSYYPIGKYMFHSIDMNELIKEKSKRVNAKLSKKKKNQIIN